MTSAPTIGVNEKMTASVDTSHPDHEMIEAFLEHLRRERRSPQTIRLRRSVLTRLNRDLTYGLGETTTEELAAWLYREEWGQNTWSNYLASVRGFYRWATRPRHQWVTFDPAVELEDVAAVKGHARPVTDDELRLILHNAAEPYLTWSTIAAYAGLRCVEISRLDREHITQQQLIVVRGKGDKARRHDTHPYIWDKVRDLPDGPVARLVRTGKRAGANYVSFMTAQHYRTLGLEGVTLHRLRHWLGVTTQRIYRDIRVTQATLGHESLSSTQIYTDATVEQQREARALLPRLAD